MRAYRPDIGVVGAGIYGVAAAIELATLGMKVTLYDTRSGILSEATANNFFRLHRGYHYPRDEETARQASKGYQAFMGMFAEALTPAVPSYYAIAREGSLTSPEQFQEHCARHNLMARLVDLPQVNPWTIAATFEVEEYYYDPQLLRRFAQERLDQFGVTVKLGWAEPALAARAHDVMVVTAYAGLNEVLPKLLCEPVELQYELCEVAIIDAPQVHGVSLIVMDGPFCSIAPWGSYQHILYDVVHSVHARANGFSLPWMHYGQSRCLDMLGSLSRFTGPTGPVKHAGSLWATRVVLPDMDATDARPARTWWASERVLAVLGGKVSASVLTGREVAAQVAGKLGLAEALT